MRVLRTLLVSAVLATVGVSVTSGPAAAQSTTTTMPPVRSIPVTPAPGVTTTTTAPAADAGDGDEGAADDAPLADTGLAADKLVPLGFVLIGIGAALTGAARRPRRTAYTYL